MTRSGPKPLPQNFIAQATSGLFYPLEGLKFIREHNLWALTSVAIGINVLLLLVVVAFVAVVAVPYLEAMDLWMENWAQNSAFWGALIGVISWIAWILAMVLILALSGVLLLLVGQAVASPFLDALSEKVECIVTGVEPEAGSVSRTVAAVAVAVGDLVWGLLYFITMQVPLLLMSVVVPVVGTGLAAVLEFCLTALLLAQEFVGLSMARHLVSYRGRWRAVWRNKSVSLGFGCTCMALLVVPGLNLVLLPLASVGGTLLYCDLKAAGRLD